MGHREISQNLTVPHMSGHISTTYLQLLMVASSGLLLQLKRKNNNSKTEERAVQVTQTSRNSRFPLTIALVTSQFLISGSSCRKLKIYCPVLNTKICSLHR